MSGSESLSAADLSPVEVRGGFFVKRDDVFAVGLGRGGKVRSCWTLSEGAPGLVTAGSRSSPQVNIVAQIAAERGIPCRVHTPTGKLSPEVSLAQEAGAEVVQHKAGRNSVIIARAREDARALGWVEIPFGMECREAVEATAAQVANIPAEVRRLVVPVGSGMSLSGILTGLERSGRDLPVLGVQVGADPRKRLRKYTSSAARRRLELVASPQDYHEAASTTSLDGMRLDSFYEGKAIPFLRPGDCLWVVGIRASEARPDRPARSSVFLPSSSMSKAESSSWPADRVERRSLSDLVPYARNAKRHSPEQIARIAASIREFGWTMPILIDPEGTLIAGHARLEAARQLGLEEVPTMVAEGWSDAQRRAYVLADNRLAEAAWDDDLLRAEIAEIELEGLDLNLTGFDPDEIARLLEEPLPPLSKPQDNPPLSETFLVPPLSILDKRQGYWTERGRRWREAYNFTTDESRANVETWGSKESRSDVARKHAELTAQNVSMFDPVLAEVLLTWFSAEDDLVIDPFAGGAVRGLVAGDLGRRYFGVDLREAQVEHNRGLLREEAAERVEWVVGDGAEEIEKLEEGSADFSLACPPYFNLEKYSDDPRDLSAMSWDDFLQVYRRTIAATVRALRPNSFAAWTVGEVRTRGSVGEYLGLVPETIRAFVDAGAPLYNECILVEPGGTKGLRAARPMQASRKVAKTHQNVLIFVKGDPREAAARMGALEIPETEEPEEGEEA
jgi:hypothetical protein